MSYILSTFVIKCMDIVTQNPTSPLIFSRFSGNLSSELKLVNEKYNR